jgi:hypothetical protein
VTDVIWEPEDRKPADAPELEAQIRAMAPGTQVKMTLRGEAWLVRALGPSALCTRGPGLAARDVSETIAELLTDAGHSATTSVSRL